MSKDAPDGSAGQYFKAPDQSRGEVSGYDIAEMGRRGLLDWQIRDRQRANAIGAELIGDEILEGDASFAEYTSPTHPSYLPISLIDSD